MTGKADVDRLLMQLRELEQLASGLREKEVPESFFGEAYELVQQMACSVYSIEQTRIATLEQKMQEQRSCIAEMGARLREEEQKVMALAREKEILEKVIAEKEAVALKPEPIVLPVQEVPEKVEIVPEEVPTSDLKEEPVAAPMKEVETVHPKMEGKSVPLLKDALEKRVFADLRKSFSLNDRFLFKKELFSNDEAKMAKAINDLNAMHSLQESLEYIKKELNWDIESSVAADFISRLEKRFL